MKRFIVINDDEGLSFSTKEAAIKQAQKSVAMGETQEARVCLFVGESAKQVVYSEVKK